MQIRIWVSFARSLVTRAKVSNQSTPLQETLLGRLMVYLNKSNEQIKPQSKNADELVAAIQSVNERRDPRKALQALDVECCLKLRTLDTVNTLKLLNAFMSVTPDQITNYNFYKYVIGNVGEAFSNLSSRNEILQFIFYLGMEKSNLLNRRILKRFGERLTPDFLDSLTVEEICIICNSMYRTKAKIRNDKFLQKIKSTIGDNLWVLEDPALFVTLLKTIKQHRYQDDDLLSTISCAVFFNRTSRFYNFTSMVHILGLYAAVFYYDEMLLKHFAERCIEELKMCDMQRHSAHLTHQPRAKDVTTFLRNLAMLGYEDALDPVVLERIQTRSRIGDYSRDPELLIETLLYLWMLEGCVPDNLANLALSPGFRKFFQGQYANSKLLIHQIN